MRKSLVGKPSIIYVAVNTLNGKKYIGVTARPVNLRKREHAISAKRNEHNGHFHRAIRKHGIEVFAWSILKECESFEDALREEIRLISEIKPEYNSTRGGESFPPPTPETIAKIKAANTGKQYRLGSHQSDEAKRLISDSARRQWKNGRGPKSWRRTNQRKVVCLDDGIVYESASAAARFYGVPKSLVISVCLKYKNYKTAGGLVFRYFGDHFGDKAEADAVRDSIYSERKEIGTANQISVVCIDDSKVYRSYEKAAEAYGLNPCKIGAVCRGLRNKTGGRRFANAQAS